MRFLAATLASLVTLPLIACSTTGEPSVDLPDTITDGAADSWAHPTEFGRLFQGVWQRGETSDEVKFPAWQFDLSADAKVTITSRQAPNAPEDITLNAANLYLYKQRDAGTWQRIAKTTGDGFPTLVQSLGEGTYRVIAQSQSADESGELMLRLDCAGDGCANAADQCLFGDDFSSLRDVKNGALQFMTVRELTVTSEISDNLKTQILEALHQSTDEDITTLADAFDAVDENVINLYSFYDELAGRPIAAIEYGAGDNSFGALFVSGGTTVAAGIQDSEITGCTVKPQACVFGNYMGEAEYMPDMKKTDSQEYTSPDGIDALTAKQIVRAVNGGDPEYGHDIAEAFENVDEGTIYVERYQHTDGRKFVEVHYYGGDNPVGAFFRDGSETPVAENSDGDLMNCTEF